MTKAKSMRFGDLACRMVIRTSSEALKPPPQIALPRASDGHADRRQLLFFQQDEIGPPIDQSRTERLPCPSTSRNGAAHNSGPRAL